MTYSKTTYLLLCALFAALTGVFSGISLPLQPVPINLATLAVFLAGGLLGKKYGAISLIVYTLLGVVGAPVFHGFTGGIGILVGPTGGYIIGYITAAFLTGIIIEKFAAKGIFAISIIAMLVGLASCYLLGTVWYMYSTSTPLWTSLVYCVIPFLIGDAIKIIAGAILIKKLRPVLYKQV